MKRFLAIFCAALGILASSANKASAWSKCNINIGLHVSREAADNSFLWGLYRSGPHPFAHAGGGPGYVPDVNPYPNYNPYPQAGAPATNPQLSAPAQSQSMPQAAGAGSQSNGTQPVGYWNNSGYQAPNSNWKPPSYWYGNN